MSLIVQYHGEEYEPGRYEEHVQPYKGRVIVSRSRFSKMAVDVGMWNVLVMGFAFMFMFTAFQTTSMIEVNILIVFSRSYF